MLLPRFQKFTFQNGKTAMNRVVVPPMASQSADFRGFVTDATICHYERLSQARAGIVFVEYSSIHSSGRGEAQQLGIESWDQVRGLSKVSQVIQRQGSLAGIQIVHAGGKSTTELTGSPLLGPSAISVPVKGWQPEVPVQMGEDQIGRMILWYLDAARRAEAAGFDFVELHAAHGYGLNQWLSPLTNQRNDTYGGRIEGRGHLLLTIAEKIKRELPQLLLAVRVPAQDYVAGGLDVQEMVWIVKQLEAVGVDLIDVSSGIGGWKRPDRRMGQGYLVADAAALKAHLSVPVIGVGGIESGEFIDGILVQKKVDFAAVGRALLRDPLDWGKQHLCASPECVEVMAS